LEYDDVINQQRGVIYGERSKVLLGEDLQETVKGMIDDVVDGIVDSFAGEAKYSDEWDLSGMMNYIEQSLIPAPDFTKEDLLGLTASEAKEFLTERTHALYKAREEEMGAEVMRQLEKALLLRIIDQKWMDHIDAMDQLRNGISLRAYGQKDPLVEYKFEAYEAFQSMVYSIKEDVVRYILRLKVVQNPEERKISTSHNEEKVKKAGAPGEENRAQPALSLRQRKKIQTLLWSKGLMSEIPAV
jgi:preprotein translocase subunit SecA